MAFRFMCGYCGVSSVSRVVSQTVRVDDSLNYYPFCLVSCDNCKNGSLISFHINSGWGHLFAGYEKSDIVYNVQDLRGLCQHPTKNMVVPEHLPPILSQIYGDAEHNYNGSRWKASTQLFLQALEMACILISVDGDEDAAELASTEKKDLTKRINTLFEAGKISHSLKEWAHQVRVVGQYHKHRYVEASETDCTDVRSFVDMFLRYTFSVPGKIEVRRAKVQGKSS